jgi:hypothetical protein
MCPGFACFPVEVEESMQMTEPQYKNYQKSETIKLSTDLYTVNQKWSKRIDKERKW